MTRGVLVLAFLGLLWFGYQGYRFYDWLPTESKLKGCFVTSMHEVKLCPQGPDYVKLNQVSSWMQKAVVVSEDGRFWSHQGFDLDEIKASIEKNLEKGTLRRGGSTLTQQLAKNLFLHKEKTMTRKVIEALITFQIERVLTKKEILEKYLNVVQFGDEIYGIKRAAQHYFKKSPAALNLAESAFLAMLLPNPKKYSKSFKQRKLTPYAKRRMLQIVYQMRASDRVGDGAFASAVAQIRGGFFGGPAEVKDSDFLSRESPNEEGARESEIPPIDEMDYSKEIELGPEDEAEDSENL